MNILLKEWETMATEARANGRSDHEIEEMKSVFYVGAAVVVNVSGQLACDIRDNKLSAPAGFEVMRGLKREVEGHFKQLEADYAFPDPPPQTKESDAIATIREIKRLIADEPTWEDKENRYFIRGLIRGMCDRLLRDNLPPVTHPDPNPNPNPEYTAEITSIKYLAGEITMTMVDDGEVPQDMQSGQLVSLRKGRAMQ